MSTRLNRIVGQISQTKDREKFHNNHEKHLQLFVHRDSLDNSERFWEHVAEEEIVWNKKWDRVITKRKLVSGSGNGEFFWYKWFDGAEMNTCFNAVDRHVLSGRGNQTALIYDSPLLAGTMQGNDPYIRHISYNELLDEINACSKMLLDLGVKKGDRILIYMPMIPEAIISMLSIARIGAVHSVVFGGFAPPELAKRIADAKPKVIISASCGIEPKKLISYGPMLHEAIDISKHRPYACIEFDRDVKHLQGQIFGADLASSCDVVVDWDQIMDSLRQQKPKVLPVSVRSEDPLYILYTSGTTGKPKGIVRDNGGHAVALKWTMKNIYNALPGDVFFAASDIGWVVGHSYICYGPLLQGCTTVLFEGKPVSAPDPSAFWRVVSTHKVKTMFTAPTAIRAIKKEDPQSKYLEKFDISSLQNLFLAGERCDPDTIQWISGAFAKAIPHRPPHVIDHWWQTETGWPITSLCVGITSQPRKAPSHGIANSIKAKFGSAGMPVPGYDVRVLDSETAKDLKHSTIGEIAIKLPLPPGTLMGLWNDEEGLVNSYLKRFPGYFNSGDAGFMDADGYVHIMSRIDDIINVSGHRLSTGAMEEVLSKHDSVAECAVFAIKDALKGEVPIGLVVLKNGTKKSGNQIISELKSMIRNEIGPIACFNEAFIVSKLPKTRSGKVLRAVLRKIANGESYTNPPTIEDISALSEAHKALDPHRAKL